MRDVRRYNNKIAWFGYGGKLKMFAPTHPRLSFHNIYDALQMAVEEGSCLGIGCDGDGASPLFLFTGARIINRSLPVHSGRGRDVRIDLIAGNDLLAVVLPAIMVVRMGVIVFR